MELEMAARPVTGSLYTLASLKIREGPFGEFFRGQPQWVVLKIANAYCFVKLRVVKQLLPKKVLETTLNSKLKLLDKRNRSIAVHFVIF